MKYMVFTQELAARDAVMSKCNFGGSYYSGYTGKHGTSQIFPR